MAVSFSKSIQKKLQSYYISLHASLPQTEQIRKENYSKSTSIASERPIIRWSCTFYYDIVCYSAECSLSLSTDPIQTVTFP